MHTLITNDGLPPTPEAVEATRTLRDALISATEGQSALVALNAAMSAYLTIAQRAGILRPALNGMAITLLSMDSQLEVPPNSARH